jgi:hypothetical protein
MCGELSCVCGALFCCWAASATGADKAIKRVASRITIRKTLWMSCCQRAVSRQTVSSFEERAAPVPCCAGAFWPYAIGVDAVRGFDRDPTPSSSATFLDALAEQWIQVFSGKILARSQNQNPLLKRPNARKRVACETIPGRIQRLMRSFTSSPVSWFDVKRQSLSVRVRT